MQERFASAFDLEEGVAFAKKGTLTGPASLRKRKADEDDFRDRLHTLKLNIEGISLAYALKL